MYMLLHAGMLANIRMVSALAMAPITTRMEDLLLVRITPIILIAIVTMIIFIRFYTKKSFCSQKGQYSSDQRDGSGVMYYPGGRFFIIFNDYLVT